MEGPSLLSCGDDLISRQKEAESYPMSDILQINNQHLPMESSVPQLHAGGEANAHLPMGPVCGAPTGNVQHAGDTSNLVNRCHTSLSQTTLTS